MRPRAVMRDGRVKGERVLAGETSCLCVCVCRLNDYAKKFSGLTASLNYKYATCRILKNSQRTGKPWSGCDRSMFAYKVLRRVGRPSGRHRGKLLWDFYCSC